MKAIQLIDKIIDKASMPIVCLGGIFLFGRVFVSFLFGI